jgi:hypothetical protein
MNRDQLIALARQLDAPKGPEEELHVVMDLLVEALPHGNILNLLYHTRPELTAEQAVDEALRREQEWRTSEPAQLPPNAPAPNPKPPILRLRPFHQFVERRAQHACFEPSAHVHVGAWLFASAVDAQRMVGTGGDDVAGVGGEDDGLIGAHADAIRTDGDEGRVFYFDDDPLDRRHQIGLAVFVLAEN